MTQKDQKTLMVLVLALFGAGLAYFLLDSWFLGPLGAYNRQLTALQDDVDSKEQQIGAIVRGRLLHEQKKAFSLPLNPAKARADYDRYLVTLLADSGLTEVAIKGPPAADTKIAAAPAVPGAPKKPQHVILTYQAQAKGNLASVVTALENLQRTPVVHRVKGLTLGRQESAKDTKSGKLLVHMTVEAMIVAGVKPGFEPMLKPDSSVKLPTSSNPRQYADIALKNIFTGPIPPLPEEPEVDPDEITQAESIIPEYVRLVSTEPTSQEAFLRNLLFQMKETRIRSKKGSGYDTFKIKNEDQTKTLVWARVLRIDQRDVYFQVKDDVYGIHIGETVTKAMRRPLSDAELKTLNLEELVQEYDPKADPTNKKAAPKKGSKSGKKRS